MSPRACVLAGAILGLLGVAAGAIGAHALRASLAPESLAIFETAVRYQMYHAIALLFTAWVRQQWPGRAARASAYLFLGGVILFSGSLYILALAPIAGIGLLTPIGGALLLAGWIALGVSAWRGA